MFLSPDPFVQFPESTQNYNRYSYVGNNPLSYADPSGFFLKKLMSVAGMVLNFVPGFQGWGNAFMRGFVTGFLGSGGDLKGAMIGGIGGHLFQGIGDKFGNPAFGSAAHLQKIAAHGVVGGLLSAAGGGRFGDGFLGAATAQAFAPAIDKIGMDGAGNISTDAGMRMARVMAAAVVGGTASHLGGGKFASEAVTAAFARLYNDEAHIKEQQRRSQISISIGYTDTPIGVGNHALVIATDIATGEQYATRAGPGSTGTIDAVAGVFTDGFRDAPGSVHTTQWVGDLDISLSEFAARANEFANITNRNNIPYLGVTSNSNSYAFTYVESLGFSRPNPIVFAPGSQFGRPSRELTYP